MRITPVDHTNKLFKIEDVFSSELVTTVLKTDWINLPWAKQENQETWPRRRIDNNALSWLPQWDHEFQSLMPGIAQSVGYELGQYMGTAFWLDEPGFMCPVHTDGSMPGSFHLTWVGDSDQGTVFYTNKNAQQERYRVPMQPNCGYAMINLPDAQGYQELHWHGMLSPVKTDKFRLTSYTWLIPQL